MPSPDSRPWLRRGLIAAVVVLLIAGGGVAYVLAHSPGNVSHPSVEFTAPTTATTPPPPPKKKPVVDRFEWPRYGFDGGRTRLFTGAGKLNPPFRVGWSFEDYALLEFPPVIYGHTLFLMDDNASAKAIDARNGHKLWETKVGTLAAASPAIGPKQGLIYLPVLSKNPHPGQVPGNGQFVALSMKTGKIRWSMPIGSGTEASPIAWEDSVYFGDQSGRVYSLNAATGHVNWIFHASGAVKGGPALVGGTLYFGDYAGRAYAVSAANGHQIWAVSTSGTHFGFGSGNFYSTPAVAFGRVYIGNTDGRVYSFAQRNGQLAWATSTGAYVYSSAAVADVPGLGPTVYLGSYDGNFYAFDAQSGSVRWRHAAGGRISGSPTIVGNVVYFSDLGSRDTTGLDVRTGHKVYFFGDGAFNPIIADPGALYLSGYSKLYQLLPVHSAQAAPAHKRQAKAKSARKH